MGKRKKAILLSVFLLVSFVYAGPVDIQTASKVAASQVVVMNERFAGANLSLSTFTQSQAQPKPLYDEAGEVLLAYVFELEPEGFIVVTADNDLVPVIAYAEQGSFPWEEHPGNILLNMLRQDLSLRLEALPLLDEEVIERNHRSWEGLIAGESAYLAPGDSWPEAGTTETGGWVETEWHQGSPYNFFCPIDSMTGVRCIVGCVATAMAQIVNYWQYPGSITFTEEDNYITETRGMEIYAPDASISEIDYNNGSPSINTCAAISLACGVGSKMDYTSSSSGAYYVHAYEFLSEHLMYESLDYDTIPDGDFYITLEDNMKNSQPALLGITEGDTIDWGHAIICDGFRETIGEREWHLNYGWGRYNPDALPSSWYVLPAGLPAGYSWVDIGILNIDPPERYTIEITNDPVVFISNNNPFCNLTNVYYRISEPGEVEISVWDIKGACIRKLERRIHTQAGTYEIGWDEKDDKSTSIRTGIYFLRVNFHADEGYCSLVTQKIVYIK